MYLIFNRNTQKSPRFTPVHSALAGPISDLSPIRVSGTYPILNPDVGSLGVLFALFLCVMRHWLEKLSFFEPLSGLGNVLYAGCSGAHLRLIPIHEKESKQ
ncbi:hypothetical protein [Marinobacterium mangrovicola]|uniref:Uncharacterized protein n=1 Tax=Marinobacterium mangrovicola TaxID=1476959 RepID=A0A4R1GKN8_9GAMM|nr:hypothetical protein [Marinobacterium mangrovicola]TCK07515.1 hypothetical protein CLV83_2385 [Marinobacterium mangrovicola]